MTLMLHLWTFRANIGGARYVFDLEWQEISKSTDRSFAMKMEVVFRQNKLYENMVLVLIDKNFIELDQ